MGREFAGKHALITGAASGIGRETAFSFAERGADLELVDIDAVGLERTVFLCRKLGVRAEGHVVDVANARDMEQLAGRIHERVSALDILVNDAGIGVAGSFVGTDLAMWDWAISVNLMGVVHGCHFFVPKMIERGTGGHVVNIASLAGIAAAKHMPVYASTKFGVMGFSESLQAELLPHGIYVTTVCPGMINTPITRNSHLSGDLADRPGYRERVAAAYRRRNYAPRRVAELIVDGVLHRRGLLPITSESWLIYFAKRISPRFVAGVLSRDADTLAGPG